MRAVHVVQVVAAASASGHVALLSIADGEPIGPTIDAGHSVSSVLIMYVA
jgi:hypothetical protein